LSTAGFYNTVGFNDDTRAFLSIPARHDVARRIDCAVLAKGVAEHRLEEDEAAELAVGLAYDFPKRAYKLLCWRCSDVLCSAELARRITSHASRKAAEQVRRYEVKSCYGNNSFNPTPGSVAM
jgi:hypothetical protein